MNARALPVDGQRVQRGYGDFGQVVDKAVRAGGQLAKGIEDAEKQANAIAVTDAETGYQADITAALQGDTKNAGNFGSAAGIAAEDAFNDDAPTGFLFTKGLTAAERSTKTLDWLEKRREERAKALANDEQKRLFEVRTGGMYQDARRKVEGHVTGQRLEAAEASVAARKAAALNAVAKDPLAEDIGRLEAGPEGAIRQFALSPEDAEAKVRKWRGDVADTRITALLTDRKWHDAEKVLEASAENLAPATVDRFKEQIARVRDAAESDRYAALAVSTSTDPATGFVDAAQAARKRENAPEYLRDEVGKRIDHKLNQAADNKKQVIAEHAAPVWEQLFQERTLSNVDPRVVGWLQKYAKDEWKELERYARSYGAEDRARAAAARARAGGGATKETDDQREALVELRADIVENPAKYAEMSAAEFTTTWGPRLSPSGYKTGGALFAGTKDNDRQGATDVSRFVTGAKTAIKGKANQAEFSAAMGDRVRAFKAEKKRDPTPDELEAMRISATTEVVTKGLLWDSKAPAYKAEADAKKKGPPAPAKPGKVWISGPGGKRGQAPEAGLDEWLKAHPGWKRE